MAAVFMIVIEVHRDLMVDRTHSPYLYRDFKHRQHLNPSPIGPSELHQSCRAPSITIIHRSRGASITSPGYRQSSPSSPGTHQVRPEHLQRAPNLYRDFKHRQHLNPSPIGPRYPPSTPRAPSASSKSPENCFVKGIGKGARTPKMRESISIFAAHLLSIFKNK